MRYFQHVVSFSGCELQWPFFMLFCLYTEFNEAFLTRDSQTCYGISPVFPFCFTLFIVSCFGGMKNYSHFFLLYRNENIYLHVYSKCSSKTCNSISTNRAICLACSPDCVPFRMTIITTATNWKWKFTNSILICSFLLASFYLSTACLMKLFDITFSPWGKYKQLAKQLQFRRERKKRIEVSSRHNQIILSSCHST